MLLLVALLELLELLLELLELAAVVLRLPEEAAVLSAWSPPEAVGVVVGKLKACDGVAATGVLDVGVRAALTSGTLKSKCLGRFSLGTSVELLAGGASSSGLVELGKARGERRMGDAYGSKLAALSVYGEVGVSMPGACQWQSARG